MPELPQMQALAERLDDAVRGSVIERVDVLGFSGLKTVDPPVSSVAGRTVAGVGHRGKYLVLALDDGARVLVHLSQAGRVDIERPPKATRPRGAVVRFFFGPVAVAMLVREHGHERKAGFWLLAPGDDGPLARLGPEPGEGAFADLLRASGEGRQLHTLLRDQRFVAGVGRGYADDALNRARVSPFASLKSLDADARERLITAVRGVIADGLDRERERKGGLSEPKLGTEFEVHNHLGDPCPNCREALLRVSFESHEVVYCKTCQTKGKVLADRRLSRLLR
jgi:formamidopyrimidine-DNA glycosylase